MVFILNEVTMPKLLPPPLRQRNRSVRRQNRPVLSFPSTVKEERTNVLALCIRSDNSAIGQNYLVSHNVIAGEAVTWCVEGVASLKQEAANTTLALASPDNCAPVFFQLSVDIFPLCPRPQASCLGVSVILRRIQ